MAWSTYAPPAQWVADWAEDATNITIPIAIIPLAAATSSLFLKADTAACDVKFYVHEA